MKTKYYKQLEFCENDDRRKISKSSRPQSYFFLVLVLTFLTSSSLPVPMTSLVHFLTKRQFWDRVTVFPGSSEVFRRACKFPESKKKLQQKIKCLQFFSNSLFTWISPYLMLSMNSCSSFVSPAPTPERCPKVDSSRENLKKTKNEIKKLLQISGRKITKLLMLVFIPVKDISLSLYKSVY